MNFHSYVGISHICPVGAQNKTELLYFTRFFFPVKVASDTNWEIRTDLYVAKGKQKLFPGSCFFVFCTRDRTQDLAFVRQAATPELNPRRLAELYNMGELPPLSARADVVTAAVTFSHRTPFLPLTVGDSGPQMSSLVPAVLLFVS